MLNTLATGSLALALATTPVLTPPPTEAPTEKITIEVVTVNGSGCRAGTTAVATSPDNTAFTVTYSDYLAQVGVGAKPTDFRKNCQLNLRIHVPSGFTYAIAQADYRGFAHLEKGASALQQANYYFQGTSPTATSTHTYNGPYSDSWHATDTKELAELVWAPCGEVRNLNINTELRVYAGSSNTSRSTSFVTMDSTDGGVSTTYHFAWQRCDK